MAKMGRKSSRDEKAFNSLINKAAEYLNTNFTKFKEDRRYHLAVEVFKKAIASETKHTGSIGINLNTLVSDVDRKRKSGKVEGTTGEGVAE